MTKNIYKGRIVNLNLETVTLPNGATVELEIIHHPGAAAVVPMKDDRTVVLIRQYRHAVGRTIYEIPAGTCEPKEPMLACAKRELAEEAGYAARYWRKVCHFYPAPGISTEWMTLFVATGLTPLKKPVAMDEDEQITVRRTSMPKVLRMVRKNEIIDVKSMIGILWGLERIRWTAFK